MTEQSAIEVNEGNLHLARSRMYSLFSSLFLDGITEQNLHQLRQIEGLADGWVDRVNRDEAAAIHFDLFQFQVTPYESLFLGDSGMVGGSFAESVMHFSHRAGCETDSQEFSFDHVGVELKILSRLCLAAQLAASRKSETELQQAELAQQAFLQAHLLQWIHPLVVAISDQPVPFFPELAGLLLELVHSHAESLQQKWNTLPDNAASSTAGGPDSTVGYKEGESGIQAKTGFVSDDQTGLREIARWLAMPCLCGAFLDKRTIAAIGRQTGLPAGFGGRQDMLENLFQAAAQYSEFPKLVSALKTQIAANENAIRGYAESWPVSQHYAEKWIQLLSATRLNLDEMVTLAGQNDAAGLKS